MSMALEERMESLESILGHHITNTHVILRRMERETQALKERMQATDRKMDAFFEEGREFRDALARDRSGCERRDAEAHEKWRAEMKQLAAEWERSHHEWKTNMEEMAAESYRKWGELANKMGTVVEDIVAPTYRRLPKDTSMDLVNYEEVEMPAGG